MAQDIFHDDDGVWLELSEHEVVGPFSSEGESEVFSTWVADLFADAEQNLPGGDAERCALEILQERVAAIDPVLARSIDTTHPDSWNHWKALFCSREGG